VHGSDVVVVNRPGEHAGTSADAAVTAHAGCRLAIRTADCAPVVLASDGAVGVVHAGWRGVLDGVVQAAVTKLRAIGGEGAVRAAIGPCIHAECYEFSPADLDAVAGRLGPTVRSSTATGRPALDVPAAVRAALADSGVELVHDADVCTACSPAHFSHRARADKERQAMVVWRPDDR
jgi:YfiH family protein